jgi:hypothetical protein
VLKPQFFLFGSLGGLVFFAVPFFAFFAFGNYSSPFLGCAGGAFRVGSAGGFCLYSFSGGSFFFSDICFRGIFLSKRNMLFGS